MTHGKEECTPQFLVLILKKKKKKAPIITPAEITRQISKQDFMNENQHKQQTTDTGLWEMTEQNDRERSQIPSQIPCMADSIYIKDKMAT